MSYIIEIATSDFQTTRSAVEGGADRIELCANLGEGGTTPSYGTVFECRQEFDVLIYPIIRPRGGDFLYDEQEFDIMLHDVKLFKQAGCDGVVIGMLLPNGAIDIERTKILIDTAYPMGVTFHRAFDRCRDPFEAMETLIEAGCERILTSGQQPTVNEGINLITELNQRADHRIIIMPGSGVRPENIKMLAEQTACTEFHSSLRGQTKTKMDFIHPAFSLPETTMNNFIDPVAVRELRNNLLQKKS